MFSGIVERVGVVERAERAAEGMRLTIAAGFAPGSDPAPGASVSVNGVCLTVERAEDGRFDSFAVAETLRVTTLGSLRVGSRVNLERALRVGDELGGHWVQGHVDGIGRVTGVRRDAGDARVTIDVPEALRRFVASKGSITVDGVSLTVAAWEDPHLTVALVPHTLERTTASEYEPGRLVNLESDLVARTLDRLLEARGLLERGSVGSLPGRNA
jgi:riboflavin synthase